MSTPCAGNPALYPATIPLPEDAVDDDAAATYSTPLEALADRTAWIVARLAVEMCGGGDTAAVLGESDQATFGTQDVDINSGITGVTAGDWVVVTVHWHAESTGAASAEFAIGYKLGAGAVTTIDNSMVLFDALGADTVPIATVAVFQAGSTDDLSIYIRQASPGGVQTVSSRGPWAASIRILKAVLT